MNNHKKLPLLLSTLLSLTAILGCDADGLESFSEVKTLRVLGVRADLPYAAPGEHPQLEMLLHDGSLEALGPDGTHRAIQVIWIEGCYNPPGDMYYLCYPALHAAVASVSDEDLTLGQVPPAMPIGFGGSYQATIPEDIIASRQKDPALVHPYGISYVFFAACGGELRKLPEADVMDFPLGCFRPGTNEQLGVQDFLHGYFPIYLFDDLRNENPIIDGVILGPGASGVPCSESNDCPTDEVCSSAGYCIGTVQRCTRSNEDDCPRIPFKPIVDTFSMEKGVMAMVGAEDAPFENIWVMYHSTAGTWKAGSQMIHDPDVGLQTSYHGYWRAPQTGNHEVRLWAVVRDNRGGVSWIWRDIWVK